MTQTLDQYKDEYAIERDRARILFGTTPHAEYLEHVRAAAALMLNLWQFPTPERMNTDVHRASWHLEEAEALRESGFKDS